MVKTLLQKNFPEWKTGSFAEFAVLQTMRYRYQKKYALLAQTLLELHQGPHAAEAEVILNEIGYLQGKVGSEFILFLKHVDKSLLPHIHAGYRTPLIAWCGLFVTLVSGGILVAHYIFDVSVSGNSWRFGPITINNFWFFFFLGLVCCGFFLKRSKFKKTAAQK